MEHHSDSVPPDPEIRAVPGPVDDKCFSQDCILIHIPPEPTVITVVPIIPHDKIIVWGNGDRTEIVPLVHRWRQNVRIEMPAMVRLQQFAIYIHFFVPDLYDIPRQTDHTLDKILARIHRIFKDDDVPSFRLTDGDDRFVDKWQLNAIYEFVHQNMITDQQGRFHGTRRDLECLDHKRPDKKRKDDGDDYRLYIFAKLALPCVLRFSKQCFGGFFFQWQQLAPLIL